MALAWRGFVRREMRLRNTAQDIPARDNEFQSRFPLAATPVTHAGD